MKNNIPLYKQIINDLLKQILNGELQPGDRIPSEHELAQSYLVSSITVKNALAELTDKGYITRQKGKGSFVNSLEALQRISTFHTTNNQRTIMKAKSIGLVMPSMKTSIDQQLLNFIEWECQKENYLLVVSITRENQQIESTSICKLRERGVSGLIIFPVEHEMYNEEILKLNLTDFPFVLVDRYLKGIRSSCIYINNYDITKEATSFLLDKGRQNIAFLSPNSHNTVTTERISGFKDAFSDRDLPIQNDNFCLLNLSINSSTEKIEYINNYLKTHPNIDALFCVNREIAKYVSLIMTKYNLWKTYKIVAFDYSDDPRITYIHQDIEKIAHYCVQELISSITSGRNDHHIVVPASLILSEL